jgi:hypothetical protein
VRAHTYMLGWAGRFFCIFYQKTWGRRGCPHLSFLHGSSVCCSSVHIVLHSFIEKKKLSTSKRPLRRDEGESLFFFFFLLRPETLKGKKRLWWRGIGKYGRHTIPITHENIISSFKFPPRVSSFPCDRPHRLGRCRAISSLLRFNQIQKRDITQKERNVNRGN